MRTNAAAKKLIDGIDRALAEIPGYEQVTLRDASVDFRVRGGPAVDGKFASGSVQSADGKSAVMTLSASWNAQSDETTIVGGNIPAQAKKWVETSFGEFLKHKK